MMLSCSAVIPNKHEREVIRENVCKELADSYGDHADRQELCCSYTGSDKNTIDVLIQTFERYPEHTITQNCKEVVKNGS